MKRSYLKKRKKSLKEQRRTEIKAMKQPLKRQNKLHDRYFKKLVTRPRRYIMRSLLLFVLVILIFTLVPIVSDFANIMSINLDVTSAEAAEAISNGQLVSEEVSNEGMVLLKNENNLLPLSNNKVNVFGISAFNFAFGGGGSGGSSSTYTRFF